MTIENRSERLVDFSERLLASSPRWNVIGEYRRGVILAPSIESGEEQKYYLGFKQFQILQGITSAGMSYKKYAFVQNNHPQTIKNEATLIYRKFDIVSGSDREKKIRLIVHLIELGVLTFEPRIPEEDWLGITEPTP